ncbi:Mss4-like protein [Lyophyllum atratum]|nr:Mss4-like protein [Lyophyllum atratum]
MYLENVVEGEGFYKKLYAGTGKGARGGLTIVTSGHHIYVADTLDGGIADHIKVIDGIELPRYIARVKENEIVPVGWRSQDISNDAEPQEDRLHAYCHCQAVSFWITRPSSASAQPSSPYPDLLHAYNSTPVDILANPADEKWWLRPAGAAHPTHYLAGHCACTSCRLTSGFDIQSWAFIPRANIFVPRSKTPSADGSSSAVIRLNLQDDTLRMTGLRQYRSSKGRNREFCGTCGATVFGWGEERPDLIDVSVGLVDEKQGGVRAERWFEWEKGRVNFEKDAVNKTLVQGLVQGLRG